MTAVGSSCGIQTTLDLDAASLPWRDVVPTATATAGRPATTSWPPTWVTGPGLLVDCLDRGLPSRGLAVAYREHDLIAELSDAGAVAP